MIRREVAPLNSLRRARDAPQNALAIPSPAVNALRLVSPESAQPGTAVILRPSVP